jgi:GAF domain-containing protein
VLDSRDAGRDAVEVALLDLDGRIVQTNAAWDDFCRSNNGDLTRASAGSSYLEACDAAGDDTAATAVAAAIRLALGGELPAPISILVPCDSPAEIRVFTTLVSSRLDGSGVCIGATVTLSRRLSADPPTPTPAVRRVAANPESIASWAPDPLPALLRLTEIVADEVDLDQTLRRLAQSTRDMLGVSYAAVGVIAAGGELDRLGFAGIDAQTLQALETPAAIAAWLEGRPASLSRDTPLGDRQLATVYVAGSTTQFSPRVEQRLGELVEAAGTAIDNALAYQRVYSGHRWAEAATELTRELASRESAVPLEAVLRSASRAASADLAALVVPDSDDTLRLHTIVGGRPDVAPGKLFARANSPAGEVIRSGKPLLLERRPPQIDEVSDQPMGPVAVVPLALGQHVIGALVVSRLLNRPPFTGADVDALSRFSNYAGIALALDQALADREQLRVHDDRTRIALDLHDNVVRQLFAVGMGLEGIIESLPDAELRTRVAGYVAAIDESIRGIRQTIYRMSED